MTKPRSASVYCRISRDRDGEGLGVARQEKDAQEWAARHGWTIAEVYVDDDISAYNGKHRPAYRQLLSDIAEGRRDGLIAWHPDRLTRRPTELEELVEVVEGTGVPIGTVTAGDIDLATPSGRMTARILGSVARHESEHKAERIARKHRELAEVGKVSGGGRRAFGYKAGGMEIEPAEARLIEEAAERTLAGEALRSVVADWNRRGVKTVTGAQWSATTLRRLLRSGRISGQREHHDRIMGTAAWPAIIDPATTWRLRAVIDDPARSGRHRGESDYVLAGLMRCGACGTTLTSHQASRKGRTVRRYHCMADRGGCNGVGIIAAPVEELVTEAVLTRLDSPALRKAVARRSKPRNGAEKALRALEAKEAELGEMWAGGEITRAAWSAARDRLARDIEAARSATSGQVREETAASLMGKGADLRKRWDRLPTETKRTIISTVVEAVTIAPTTKAVNRFDEGRVSVLWRA